MLTMSISISLSCYFLICVLVYLQIKRIVKMKEKYLSIIEALHLIAVLARHDLTLRVIMIIIMNN